VLKDLQVQQEHVENQDCLVVLKDTRELLVHVVQPVLQVLKDTLVLLEHVEQLVQQEQ
jgi:hypothetical protein